MAKIAEITKGFPILAKEKKHQKDGASDAMLALYDSHQKKMHCCLNRPNSWKCVAEKDLLPPVS
jgi:hypothetical protein